MIIKFNIAGLQHYNYQQLPEFADNMPGSLVGQAVDLVNEPNNEYDANAIRIEKGSIKLGYVPKRWNVVIHGMLKDHDMKAEIDYFNPDAMSHKAFGIVCTFQKKVCEACKKH